MTIDNGIRIEGRGGKDSGSTPSEDRDSLRSTQIADILDLISEGECQGLKNGLKSLFLDGVPYENEDGSRNFTGLDFAWTVGSQGQAALPGMPGVQSEHTVGVLVHADTPIVRTVSSSDVDRVRVTIGVPQLSAQDMESGDLHGSSFEFAIDVQSNGGGYNERYRRTITGKNMSMYTRSVIVPLTGGAPYDIRVRRITADSPSSTLVNAFSWVSYTEIQSIKLRYPNSALALLRVDAKQFGRVPVRSYHWLGVRVQVPSNYDPITRAYTGAWDGTFKLAWTNNPAWCLFSMITNPRFGLGEFVDPAFNNKWALYKIGQYCDVMVPDGKGGSEPRFTFNYQFTTRAEAYKVLRDMSAVFRGLLYWSNGSVEYSQDAPAEAELLYTPANVESGVFTYEDTSEKSLHSVFIAYWNDLKQHGKRVPEVYAPDDLIARYGVREMAMDLFGCTSRGQAARMCRWARYSEQHEGTLVSFKVGSDGQVCAPGKLFQIADPSEAGERLGGRIKAATTATVTLDAPVELRAGETYTVTVVSPIAGEQLATVTEQRTVTTLASTTDTLTVSPAFSQAPAAGTIWVLQSDAIAATWWRCLGVKEVSGKNQYVITGVAHHPGKFDEVELGLVLDETPISRLSAVVVPPASLALLETVYTDGTTNRSRLTASWIPSAPNLQHTVYWRRDSSWWQKLPPTGAQTVDIGPLDPGVYEVKVTSTNPLGNTSLATQGSITIAGGPSGIRAVRLKTSSTAFKVATSDTPTPSSIQITADQGGLVGDIEWALVSGSATLSGSGNNRTLAYSDMSSESVTISASVVDKGQTFSDLITIIKVRDGNPGEAGATGETGPAGTNGTNGVDGAPASNAMLSLDVIALPADDAGAVTSYTGAFTSLVIWAGDTIDSTGWTYTRVNSSGITSSLSGATLTINSVAEATDSGYVDITATRSGSASITKRVSIVKNKQGPTGATGDAGVPGQRGSVQIAKEISGSTWSDSAANSAITGAGYSSVVKQDMVTLYNSTSGFSEARFFDGASWLAINAYINGNLLVAGTVGADILNVTKLSAITADLGTVTLGRIESDVVIAGQLDGAGGVFSGVLSAEALHAVNTINLADDAVTVPTYISGAGVASEVVAIYGGVTYTREFPLATVSTSPDGRGLVLIWKDGGNLLSQIGGAATNGASVYLNHRLIRKIGTEETVLLSGTPLDTAWPGISVSGSVNFALLADNIGPGNTAEYFYRTWVSTTMGSGIQWTVGLGSFRAIFMDGKK